VKAGSTTKKPKLELAGAEVTDEATDGIEFEKATEIT
jgi:hypothetical protein